MTKSDGSIELRGIMYGGLEDNWWLAGWYGDAYVSDLNAIEIDMGSLQVMEFSAVIWGPTAPPENTVCQWSANVKGGRPPFTYQWQRDFDVVGTGSTYSANAGIEGDYFSLTLTVIDAGSNVAQDVIAVAPSSWSPSCTGY
jgi:hypothetical protein